MEPPYKPFFHITERSPQGAEMIDINHHLQPQEPGITGR